MPTASAAAVMRQRSHRRQQPVKGQMVGGHDLGGQGCGQGIGESGDEQRPTLYRRHGLKGAGEKGACLRHAGAGGHQQRRRPGAQKRLHRLRQRRFSRRAQPGKAGHHR